MQAQPVLTGPEVAQVVRARRTRSFTASAVEPTPLAKAWTVALCVAIFAAVLTLVLSFLDAKQLAWL